MSKQGSLCLRQKSLKAVDATTWLDRGEMNMEAHGETKPAQTHVRPTRFRIAA